MLKRILERIEKKKSLYLSPTDMGVNRAGFGIIDDEVVCNASKHEVIRRFFRYSCEYVLGLTEKETVQKAELLMEELGACPEDRSVVLPARKAAEEAMQGKGNEGIYCGAAVELPDGNIVTGKNSPLIHAASSLILNAVKKLAGIPDSIHLLSPHIIESIRNMKGTVLGMKTLSLDLEETLIALTISATNNPTAQAAMEKLKELKNCEMHMTHLPTPGDEAGLRKLGINVTTEPNFSTKSLFVS